MNKLACLLAIAIAPPSMAALEDWTSKDGRTARLDLIRRTEKDGEMAGEFRTQNGTSVTLKGSDLDDASRKRLADAPAPVAAPGSPFSTAPAASTAPAEASVFDEYLDDNLVKLDGKSVRKFADYKKPSKYYVFYYSASWCGPCQKYTPSLATLYNKIKPGNDKFELILISADRDEESMEGYMKSKSMPWPALKFSKLEKFRKQFNHGVRGIPSVITCSPDGTIVSRSEFPPELEKLLTE